MVLPEHLLLLLSIPEQNATACEAIPRGSTKDKMSTIGVGQQRMWSIDRGCTGGEKPRVCVDLLRFGVNPGCERIPLQEKTSRVAANEISVPLAGDGVPLTMGGTIRPGPGRRIKLEEAHRERRATTDGIIRGSGDAHQMRALAGILEVILPTLCGRGIFDDQFPFDRVAEDQLPTGREGAVEQGLAGRDDGFGVAAGMTAHFLSLSFV